jgi:MFS family permease
VTLRAGLTMFAASAVLALLPSVARALSHQPIVYGVLLGCFGIGAVLGAVALQPARARWSLEAVASGAVVILGVMLIACGVIRSIPLLAAALVIAGAGWLVFISVVTALVQTLAPDWVRARAVAVFILVFQGGLAAGSALWGGVATAFGFQVAFVCAGIGTIGTIVIGVFSKLPDAKTDTTPWNHWRMPAIIEDVAPALEHGAVFVTVRYRVRQAHDAAFVLAMEDMRLIRRRDGASWWGVFRDLERADVFLETFLVTSWAEHVRQHDRFTLGDGRVETEIRSHIVEEPLVEHFIRPEEQAHGTGLE